MSLTPTLLLILDGLGFAPSGPGNAVSLARIPHINALLEQPNVAVLQAGGRYVGLPAGYMGNSEVGHLTIGSGRIVYQDMARIDVALETGELAASPVLNDVFSKVQAKGGRVHFMGLLSDAGVHSHIAHLEALLHCAADKGVSALVHAFTDGRDTSPNAGAGFVERLEAVLKSTPKARLASLCGRYYAMDRDKRWERVKLAWDMLVHGTGEQVDNAAAALRAAYAQGETDEFIKPRQVGVAAENTIRDGDGVFFFNFRADRARELLSAFVKQDFAGFDRGQMPHLAGIASMVSYDESLTTPVVFHKDNLEQTLGEEVSRLGLSQLRIAETEKYAHVTYFLNGGREEQFPGEERVLVESPKDVATYDLKPEMSAVEVCDKLLLALASKKYTLLVCNFANPDMVGHTGKMPAAIKALECVDACLGRILPVLKAEGVRLVMVADHGNVDEMILPNGEPSTSHSLNPVRMVVYEGEKALPIAPEGGLADIAPTILGLWGVTPPSVMSGKNLMV